MKKLSVNLGILIILLSLYLFIKHRKDTGFSNYKSLRGELVTQGVDFGKTNGIVINEGDKKVNLVKSKSKSSKNNWVVKERYGYKADFDKIVDMIDKLGNLKIKENISIGPEENELNKFKLNDSNDKKTKQEYQSKKVKFKLGKKDNFILYIGKEQKSISNSDEQFSNMMTGSSKTFFIRTNKIKDNQIYTVSESFNDISVNPSDWLDKKFFDISNIKSLEIKYKDSKYKEEQWSVSRKSLEDELMLDESPPKGKEYNEQNISGIRTAFTSPTFTDISKDYKLLDNQTIYFKIQTFDNFEYNITLGELTEEQVYPMQVKVNANIKNNWSKLKGSIEKEIIKELKKEIENQKSKKDSKDKDQKLKNKKEEVDKKRIAELLNERKIEYEKSHKALVDKYKFEKSLDKFIYFVNQWSIRHLILKKSELFQDIKKENPNKVSIPNLPNSLAN